MEKNKKKIVRKLMPPLGTCWVKELKHIIKMRNGETLKRKFSPIDLVSRMTQLWRWSISSSLMLFLSLTHIIARSLSLFLSWRIGTNLSEYISQNLNIYLSLNSMPYVEQNWNVFIGIFNQKTFTFEESNYLYGSKGWLTY